MAVGTGCGGWSGKECNHRNGLLQPKPMFGFVQWLVGNLPSKEGQWHPNPFVSGFSRPLLKMGWYLRAGLMVRNCQLPGCIQPWAAPEKYMGIRDAKPIPWLTRGEINIFCICSKTNLYLSFSHFWLKFLYN